MSLLIMVVWAAISLFMLILSWGLLNNFNHRSNSLHSDSEGYRKAVVLLAFSVVTTMITGILMAVIFFMSMMEISSTILTFIGFI